MKNFYDRISLINQKSAICMECDEFDDREGYCAKGSFYILDSLRLDSLDCPLDKW